MTSPQRDDDFMSRSLPHYSSAFPKHSHHCLDSQIIERSTYAVDGGGYSDIWTGSYQDRTVAIKILRPFSSRGKRIEKAKLLKRLWREYLASSRHFHPNVLKCIGYSYDFSAGSDYEVPSLISPWMPNGTINAYIREYPDVDRLKLVVGIAEGLSYLHAQQPATVHGDLRAGNILVSDVGVPCLTDFGLSKILGDGAGLTTSSHIGGSSRWMSPELVQCGKADKSSDVWAFSMTVLEIMSGQCPYHETHSEPMVLLQIMDRQLPARPLYDGISTDLTDDLWALCLKCWAFQPKDRPSMREILLELPCSPTRNNDIRPPESSPLMANMPSVSNCEPSGRPTNPRALGSGSGTGSGHSKNHNSTAITPAAKPGLSDSNDDFKSLKASLDDPVRKVLPVALEKYQINNEDWQNYVIFICYGSTERCLSYDEKPLLLFKRLKDAKKNPIFMLKRIGDIQSPIALVRQKQAARQMAKAAEACSTSTASLLRPQEAGSLAPLGPNPKHNSGAAEHLIAPSFDGNNVEKEIGYLKDVSYAVAVYPYFSEQEDELDVVVGGSFIILQRARGWWVVQRDPTGAGIVEYDPTKRGWVPAGCLLETNVPVASAVAQASGNGANATADVKPILPFNIISVSFPGISLMDYRRKGEGELDITKDDTLRVFKRYNHWSYAVKEDGGARGWVPSWFIGKVAGSGIPQTPCTAVAPNGPIVHSPATLESDLRYAGIHGQPAESILQQMMTTPRWI